jgi:hypothetical protein
LVARKGVVPGEVAAAVSLAAENPIVVKAVAEFVMAAVKNGQHNEMSATGAVEVECARPAKRAMKRPKHRSRA